MFLTSHKTIFTVFAILIAAIVTPGVFAKTPLKNSPATAGQLRITEFRLRGPGGANDEFIEIYNNSGTDHTVTDSGAGYPAIIPFSMDYSFVRDECGKGGSISTLGP